MESGPPSVWAINVAKMARRTSELESLAQTLDELTNSTWALCFVLESDCLKSHREERYAPTDGSPIGNVWRHWPGPGSFAMKLMVRKNFVTKVTRRECEGRAMAVALKLSSEKGTQVFGALERIYIPVRT